MTVFQDGVLVRESWRPEVWFIEGGTRRWVPDSETVESLGGWISVRTVRAPDRILNAIGPMRNSVIQPYKWDDGSLLIADPLPDVYVMETGRRRWIPDPQTFQQGSYRWDEVQNISSVEMNAIERGPDIQRYQPPFEPMRYEARTGPVFMGAGHWMETNAQLAVPTGVITGQTRTWTQTWLGGFHGGCYLILSDVHGYPVPNGQSPLWRFGVDGTWIGRSDRTDAFEWHIDPNVAKDVRAMTVLLTWAPDSFQDVLGKWVAAGKQVAELATSAGGVAKAFAGAGS